MEDGLHDLGVSGDLLLVAGGEGFDLQIGEQALHVAVGEFAALDAGGGADALNGRHAAQGVQALGRQGSQRAPCSFELVDLGDEGEHFRRNRDVGGLEHLTLTPIYTPISTHKSTRDALVQGIQGSRAGLGRSGAKLHPVNGRQAGRKDW